MKFYIISGEASGDLHGSRLIKAMLDHDANSQFRAWGGDKMKQAGATLAKHYKDLAFMGFVEVIKNLPQIISNFRYCKKDIIKYNPDAIILIDYPGFNLRIAKWAHKNNYRIIYYISPQLWAWQSSRYKVIKRYVDDMITILPFEPGFYENYGLKVHYVGHPLVEEITSFTPNLNFKQDHNLEDKDILLLMPGSRTQEVTRMLPIMVEACNTNLLNKYQIIVAGVSTIDKDIYTSLDSSIKLIIDENYNLMHITKYAWVSSGTATLELALFNIPQIVCYKTSPISYSIAKRVIRVPHISLVNLIAEQEIVEELIQEDFTPNDLMLSMTKMEINHDRIIDDYKNELLGKLSQKSVSKNVAQIIFDGLK